MIVAVLQNYEYSSYYELIALYSQSFSVSMTTKVYDNATKLFPREIIVGHLEIRP
jgi:hypothetical protein